MTPRSSNASTPARRGLKRRIFRPLSENGPEHEAKEAAVLVSELDIGKTRPDERSGAPCRALHRRSELAETLRGDGSKKVFLAGEMPVCGRRRNADPSSGLPQPNRLHAVFVQNLTGCGQKRGRQVPVAIGPCGMHSILAYRVEFTV